MKKTTGVRRRSKPNQATALVVFLHSDPRAEALQKHTDIQGRVTSLRLVNLRDFSSEGRFDKKGTTTMTLTR